MPIPPAIRTKRWDDPRDADDGYRLLICRYRPRGVPRTDETWDAWCQALAPSVELHADAYGKATGTNDGERLPFAEYRVRFLREMERQRFWIEGFAARVKGGETITLLCSSACVDPARCHRTLVKELIEAVIAPRSRPSSPIERGQVIVRRRQPS